MKNSLLSVLFLLASLAVFAQHPQVHSCYMDEIIKKNLKQNPELGDKYFAYEENLKAIQKELELNPNSFKNIQTDTLVNGKRIIPVVFHVIHIGGTENIAKTQIEDAVAKMNLDYNRQNADTANTFSLFKSRAASFDIEFRLARLDPNGNCTDGIDRVYDPATEYAQYNVMTANSWSYSKYMNVYTVKFIYPEGMDLPDGALIGGLSPFTPDNTLSGTSGDTLKDGVLVRHDAVGTIGTAANFAGIPGYNNRNRVMTHETGHFLNLYHTFQDITSLLAGGDGCGLSIFGFYISNGDEITDTPPVAVATQGCPAVGSVNTCDRSVSPYGDEPDMIENFMDYSNGVCQNAFTNDQKTRITTTLTTTRQSLWSKENLIATGVLDTTAQLCAPTADFYYNRTMVCEGGTVAFTDWSYNGATDAWEWTFDGGTPSSSTEQNPTVTYDTEGIYNVTLRAINATGDDILTKSALIKVSALTTAQSGSYYEDFETGLMSSEWEVHNQNGNQFSVVDTVAYDGTHCLTLGNFYGNSRFSDDHLITQAFNLTSFSGVPKLKFKTAYAGKRSIVNNPLTGVTDTTDYFDNLKVYVSYTCGQTWNPIYNKSTTLPTVALMETGFKPSDLTEWREEVVSLTSYYSKPNVRFKFYFKSAGGNNLYIDDINIDVPTTIDEILASYNVNIVPNPIKDDAVIFFETAKNENVSIKLYDIVGKELANVFDGNVEYGSHEFNLNSNLFNSSGVYFVKIKIDNYEMVKKVIFNK